GRLPFDGESSQEIIMKHLTADPDLTGVAQPYRSIIERALQKDPAKRYHSASEMLTALVPPSAPIAPAKPTAGPLATGTGLAGTAIATPVDPLYIGDDSDGIQFGPLQEHPENAAVNAEVMKANGYPAARPGSEEPIAKAARAGWKSFAHWWNYGPLTTPLKICILLAVAVAAIVHGEWLLPVAVVLGSRYLVYLGLRLLGQAI